jgi:Cdc6-like AAA superfamily ATPase
MLKKVISESLTVDRNSFNDDFFSRYTASVNNLELLVTAQSNLAVYGRRGAGKSSLLAFAMHTAIKNKAPYSWVPMQQFATRTDDQVVPAILSAILFDLNQTQSVIAFDDLIKNFDVLSESEDTDVLNKCDKLIPRVRRQLSLLSSTKTPLTIFLDDLHVLGESIQPAVLAFVYKLTRGNNASIKISGISQLTRLWDSKQQIGLQPSHDVQILSLDLNLTMPDRSRDHIVSILDAHAKYCGLPSIGYLNGEDVISRLVLVAAGVPRDSLSLFSLALGKAAIKGQKLVSVTSINAAASEMAEEKLKDIERDHGNDLDLISAMLEQVKKFCISKQKKNSFLVEIKNSSANYKTIQKLVALRLVHMLHEGITPHKAGQRYMALMLDYGFYVGIRAARSIDFIPSEPQQLSARELRNLPIFS